MAQPDELFRGKAPIAMAQMGQGIADAYARAGATEGQAYQQLGQTIGGALQTAASTYAGYKQQQSQVKAQEKALDTFMPFLTEEMRASISSQREALNSDPNASLADKKAYYDSTMSFAGNAVGQYFQMQKVGAEQGGATGRTIISENAANARNTASLENALERERLQSTISFLNSPNAINMQRASSFAPTPLQIGTQMGGGIYRK